MPQPIRLAINGASGRMGQALLALLREDRRFELVHAVVSAGSEHNGTPVFAGLSTSLRYSHNWENAPSMDVVIDFSGPEGLAVALAHCTANGIALVTGTTGIDAALEAKLDDATNSTAVLRAANFSLGVAVLTRLLREAAAALPDWDLEIVEAHHGRKEDAPSGTALALGHAAADARSTTLAKDGVYVREGRPGARRSGSIGFAVVRGGDVVGEHTALLLGHGERVELSHRATDRSIFARGALEAAAWLVARQPGAYSIDDMLQERSRKA
ncbi:4-hydroxy-tetrahydrodipicolinate reductase [Dyella caseinilytica]|uniref:4-hydroxy-tetrahydrodipicolinate reductase n=1 Tax=Dyella caseinilytica TaxID=1849581 RepID=A0ABX7GYK0_9GAMM|nr:4-hydroxy-tetrahydrodipicolinate reductase [Dyella caseinilytica]QRN55410.1 4-hydroxy-tetrahydrodipicolinate reductase [Dyella caseinilytica]GGA01490.1 4-hydroxy-tetrahydrodipicolinate reductase [Dyella caseinilytica]